MCAYSCDRTRLEVRYAGSTAIVDASSVAATARLRCRNATASGSLRTSTGSIDGRFDEPTGRPVATSPPSWRAARRNSGVSITDLGAWFACSPWTSRLGLAVKSPGPARRSSRWRPRLPIVSSIDKAGCAWRLAADETALDRPIPDGDRRRGSSCLSANDRIP